MQKGGACSATSPAPQAYALFLCVSVHFHKGTQWFLQEVLIPNRIKHQKWMHLQNVAKCEISSVISRLDSLQRVWIRMRTIILTSSFGGDELRRKRQMIWRHCYIKCVGHRKCVQIFFLFCFQGLL